MESLMPEITSNPGACCAYLTPRFYYPIGNTSAVDLTEGCCIPDEASFLLLGCGDIRNILHTVSEIQQVEGCHPPKSVHFHLNDVDPYMLARDAVLLSLVNTIDPSNVDDLHLLWSVWYNLALTENEFQRLHNVLMDLLQNTNRFGMSYGSSKLKSTLSKVWKTWLACGTDVEAVQKNRRLFIQKQSKREHRELTWEEARQILSGQFSCRGGVWDDEVDAYVASGSIRENSQVNLPNANLNATFVRQDTIKWMMHPGITPFDAWEHHRFNKNISLTTQCLEQLRNSVHMWQAFQKRSGMVKVTLWGGDCLELMDGLPEDVRFDFINTSNLADHIGLLNILLWTTPRLKAQGILTIQSLFWNHHFKTVKQYLEHHLGFPASLFPTILGVRLVEDLEIGVSKQPLFGFDANSAALTLRWLQSSEESTALLSLNGTDGVYQAVLGVAKKCLAIRVEEPDRSGSLCYNLLTLIRLVKRIAGHIQGGEKSLLELISRNFSSVIAINESNDGPLSQSWQTILDANRTGNQGSPESDGIRKVVVPVQLTLVGKKALDICDGIGFDIDMQGCIIETPVDLLKISLQMSCEMPATAGPVHILPCVGYDYETSSVTFYTRKSSWDRLPDVAAFVFRTTVCLPTQCFSPVLNLRHVATVTDVPCQSLADPNPRHHGVSCESAKVVLCEEETIYSLVWSHGSEACEVIVWWDLTPLVDPNTATMKLEDAKGIEETKSVVFKVSCPVIPKDCRFQTYYGKVVATMAKRMDWFLGCLELPYRRIEVERIPGQEFPWGLVPLYEATWKHWMQAPLLLDSPDQVDGFAVCVGNMFSGPGERLLKIKQGKSTDPFYNLRETLQRIFLQALNQHPQIKAYFILVGEHSPSQKCGDLPEDIVIHVRGLHVINGLPTLHLNWTDFLPRIFRDNNDILQMGLHNPSVVDSFTVMHCPWDKEQHTLRVTKKEATLLRRLLRCNSRRVVQDGFCADENPPLMASYLQPLYPRELGKIPSGYEWLRDWQEELKAAKAGTTADLQELSIQSQPEKSKCSRCGRSASYLRRCSRCKSAFYCNNDCQRADWREHKGQCHGATPRTGVVATSPAAGAWSSSAAQASAASASAPAAAPAAELAGPAPAPTPRPTAAPVQAHEPAPTHIATGPGARNGQPESTLRTGLRTCGKCGRTDRGLRKCARCLAMYYCSVDCQHKHWREHKTQCKK